MADEFVQRSSDASASGDASSSARLAGVGMLAIGLLISAAATGWVIYEAKTGAAEIRVPKGIIGSGVGAACLGLLGVIFGPRAISIIESMNKRISEIKWYEWLILIATSATGVCCYHFLISYLETLGYHAR